MEIVDRIIKELRPIAEKIGEGAEFLWETLMIQIMLRGGIALFLSILIVFTAIYFFPKFLAAYQVAPVLKKSYGNDEWSAEKLTNFWGAIFTGAAGVGGLMLGCFYAVPRLINPAYYALKEILRVIQ